MNKNILVIDNDPDLEEIIRHILADKPYDIQFYEDTDDIFTLIDLHKPELILLDYNLNGESGGEMCTELKTNKATHKIPIVLFSAYPKLIYVKENFGFDAFIEKPFDIDEFVQIIDGFLMK